MIQGRWYSSLSVLCLVLLFGCTAGEQEDAPSSPPSTTAALGAENPAEDSVFAFLQAVDDSTLINAFASVGDAEHVRYERTEQYDAEGFRIAFEERTIRYRNSETNILSRDSAGSFDYGYLSRFVSAGRSDRDPSEVAAYAVPDDPPYLSARTREAYTYRASVDTLIGGVESDVIEVYAHPETGRDQVIRRAQLFVEKETGRLVALYVARRDVALWFREESGLFLSIRPLEPGRWVPHHTRFETLIRMPFRPTQRFRTVATFYGYPPA